ncbi:DUF4870 domain-containing protein [Metabacillus arenae]|uniref:DUF4870 domain-containing protein n=1 Tax=Metabacillus arenae TaxID=2771434 RepID=A0A926NH23_9BACI|nr:DUF4870 domain-containing protein [Metabacillus arenae]MBD1381429.1 DUF4870 domain-containing protein [Metabacillus arenae]
MTTNKVISSLCYFSVFFAPFLFPLVVYFVVDEKQVKNDAKSSFLSHIVPIISIIVLMVVPILIASFLNGPEGLIVGSIIVVYVLVVIINIAVIVWNVIKGIKVLKTA